MQLCLVIQQLKYIYNTIIIYNTFLHYNLLHTSIYRKLKIKYKKIDEDNKTNKIEKG
jgi:hypothetical protein